MRPLTVAGRRRGSRLTRGSHRKPKSAEGHYHERGSLHWSPHDSHSLQQPRGGTSFEGHDGEHYTRATPAKNRQISTSGTARPRPAACQFVDAGFAKRAQSGLGTLSGNPCRRLGGSPARPLKEHVMADDRRLVNVVSSPGASVIGRRRNPGNGSDRRCATEPTKTPVFTKDVAPIFQEKCQACHRPATSRRCRS